MSELKAVLLDVDGTLAETERHGHLVAFNRAFKEFGLDWQWSPALYGELLAVTGSTERTYHYVEQHNAPYKHVNADLDGLIEALIKYKNQAYLDIVNAGEIPLRPGVARALREIHESDVRLAVVTTTGFQNVESLLQSNIGGDVMEWFDVIAAGNIVPNKKPAPDIYEYALDKMQLKAKDCLAIEDSENGVRAATVIDIPVLVTLGEYSVGHDLSGALAIVDTWGEPDAPMKTVDGKTGAHTMIDLAMMRELMASVV